jgi:GNAT superfamily N-acetyltransferase
VTVKVRVAVPDDVAEIVRLAALMYESMGIDASDPLWQRRGQSEVRSRLGADLVAFVVDHPRRQGLVASGVGTIAQRLPSPGNPGGRAGYVQWVATDPEFRRRGLARQVMQALMRWYEAAAVPAVELHATPVGEPLYRSLGFSDGPPLALRRVAEEGGGEHSPLSAGDSATMPV